MKPNYRLIEALLKEAPMKSTTAGSEMGTQQPTTMDPFDIPQPYNVQPSGQREDEAYDAIRTSLDQLMNYAYSMQQNYPGAADDINVVLQHLEAAKQAVGPSFGIPSAVYGYQDPLFSNPDPLKRFR